MAGALTGGLINIVKQMKMQYVQPTILFLSGASGVGKTSVLDCLKRRHTSPNWVFLHYDSVGVPPVDEMIRQAGSPEHWQEITTHRWIEKIITDYRDKHIVIIEGQSNLDFVEAACRRFNIKRFIIVLLDCDWETMITRLQLNRGQPELANAEMRIWADFLRGQAQRKGLPVIETSHQTLEQVAEYIENVILAERAER